LLNANEDLFSDFIKCRIIQTEEAINLCKDSEHEELMTWYYAGKLHAFYEALYWKEMSGRPVLE
jgi:hypothetical protein